MNRRFPDQNIEPRPEQEIFLALERLCASSGYAHAIAYFCERDNTIKYIDQMGKEDVLQQFTGGHLIRTEISTLIGLAVKGGLDTKHPTPPVLHQYIDESETLLEELHHALAAPMFQHIRERIESGDHSVPFYSGHTFREAIFYGGEAAYNSQGSRLAGRSV